MVFSKFFILSSNVYRYLYVVRIDHANETSTNELFLPFSSPLTLFAPTNEAFEDIPREVFNQLDSNTELLKNVLLGHVIPQKSIFYRNGDLTSDQVYESAALNGTLLRVNVYLKNKFYDVSLLEHNLR